VDQWALEDASQWRFQFRRIYHLLPHDPRVDALSDAEIRYEVQRWLLADQIARGDRTAPPSTAWLAATAAQLAAIPLEDINPAPTTPVSADTLFGSEALDAYP